MVHRYVFMRAEPALQSGPTESSIVLAACPSCGQRRRPRIGRLGPRQSGRAFLGSAIPTRGDATPDSAYRVGQLPGAMDRERCLRRRSADERSASRRNASMQLASAHHSAFLVGSSTSDAGAAASLTNKEGSPWTR